MKIIVKPRGRILPRWITKLGMLLPAMACPFITIFGPKGRQLLALQIACIAACVCFGVIEMYEQLVGAPKRARFRRELAEAMADEHFRMARDLQRARSAPRQRQPDDEGMN